MPQTNLEIRWTRLQALSLLRASESLALKATACSRSLRNAQMRVSMTPSVSVPKHEAGPFGRASKTAPLFMFVLPIPHFLDFFFLGADDHLRHRLEHRVL